MYINPTKLEQIREENRQYMREHISELSPEERLRGLQPEMVLQNYRPEERLRGLQPEMVLQNYRPEERLRGLQLEEILQALAPEQLEALLRR